ncbi:MAG: M23 family peptidase, partial [Bacteroidota bacterium]
MIRNTLFFFLINLIIAQASAQPYPKRYFSPPIDGPLILTGTFGEVRSEHFHSGIDLSTGGTTGMPVKAAAEGYVSR